MATPFMGRFSRSTRQKSVDSWSALGLESSLSARLGDAYQACVAFLFANRNNSSSLFNSYSPKCILPDYTCPIHACLNRELR